MERLAPVAPSVRAARPVGIPAGTALLFGLSLVPLLLIALPVAALLIQALRSGTLLAQLREPVVATALGLSVVTSAIALGLTVLFGTPLAYALARLRFPGRGLVDTLVDLPVVLPPAVAGVGLLMAFGRRGLLGPALGPLGIEVAFTSAAVVLAQTFVAAPFYVRAAKLGFEGVDPMLERVAATLGVSEGRIFRRVTVPLALPGLLGGAIMAWARALGEFGATIMFAGNLPGRTQTMPLAIYTALESDLGAALAISLLLVMISFAVLWLFRRLTRDEC